MLIDEANGNPDPLPNTYTYLFILPNLLKGENMNTKIEVSIVARENMNNKIQVSVVANETKERIRFSIEIPYSFMMNDNFMEVMKTYSMTDTARWLEALAMLIRNNTEGDST